MSDIVFFFLLPPRPPRSTLFPYTTLFRSDPSRWVYQGFQSWEEMMAPNLGFILDRDADVRSEEHTSELQSLRHLVCRLLLEKKKCHRYWRLQCDATACPAGGNTRP